MYSRMLKLPLEEQSSLFLFGPRGTGKTSWIKAKLPDALYLDLLDFGVYSSLLSDPGRLEKLIPPNFKNWVIIDEIQKVPLLLNEVHRLIESKKIRFLLTGSSARKLKQKGVNLLAGRALTYHMHPLIAQELGADFSLEHALRNGLLPASIAHADPSKFLQSYVQTYVREEVLQEGLTRNIGAFVRFLEMASFSQGAVLNMSEIAREAGVDRQVISSYFDILEDLLLAQRVLPFAKRAKRRLIAHPKFFFVDAGIYRILRPVGPLDKSEEIDGAGLETVFFQSVRALNDYLNLGYNIHYWHPVGGSEVDFVLYGPQGLLAFEIKRTKTISAKSLRGLKAFGEEYPEAKLYLIFGGNRREYHGAITAIPMAEALVNLPQILTLKLST
jgi:predicted AAA+ superfamily ATPase